MYKRFLPQTLLVIALLILFACIGVRGRDVAVFSLAAEQEEKTVYLTFDDGPSTRVTNEILDVLKEEKIKGTFFIVSNRALTRKDTLKRIAAEGHTLGVHSASHEYKEIYASDEALFKDIDECAAVIRAFTGTAPAVYRFPGGGKGRERQAKLIGERGYRIVGWNAVCGDEEILGADADTLYRETVRTARGKNSVVLLMHDSAAHKNTAAALPRIIEYFRGNGYRFCAF